MIRNLLYILQIENYSLKNFLRFAYSHPNWRRLEKRMTVIWTKKAVLIYALSWGIILAVLIASILNFGVRGLVVIIPVALLLPIIISLALIILTPVDVVLKNQIVRKAKNIITENKNLIVIGIAGSYGKTSSKEILCAILKEKYKVIAPDKNVNTDIGIADFIIKNREALKNSDIFIVEMGAFKMQEIKKICSIVNPDYGVLTGINESHLEKFGSLENIIKAKFELPQEVKKLAVLNFDDENIKRHFARFQIKKITGVSQGAAKNTNILDDFKGVEFTVNNIKFHTKLLATHNISLIMLCIEIAKNLGMSLEEIVKGVEKVDYIKHRLEPIYNSQTNIWIIDDSYNGNFAGFRSGVEILEKARGRKIVLTPGLVELGKKSKEIHNQIGELYENKKIDLVLLIRNRATPFIAEKLRTVPYKMYNSTREAHSDLVNVLRSGDTIIFQNDWPDNYF